MATTINSLGVNLGMDAKGFIDGAKVSRSEARMLAKDIEAARNPTEQLAVEQDRLKRALDEGAISIDVYNRLIETKRQKLGELTDEERSLIETEKSLAAEQERINKLAAEGESITKKYMTEEQQFAFQKKHLDSLLASQSIGMETYSRAMNDARHKTIGLNDEERSLLLIQRQLEQSQKDGAAATLRFENAHEKASRQLSEYAQMLASGAISHETYRRAVIDVHHSLNALKEPQTSLLDLWSRSANIVSGVRNGIDMVSSAFARVGNAIDAFGSKAQFLDDVKDKAEKLGMTFNELGSIEFATKRLGGDDAASALDSAMGKMLKNGFVESGETAVDAFKRAADEIAGMATQTERAQRASEIFGKSGIELLAVLQSGSEEIGNLADQWERTNGLTQVQLEFIGDYSDRWEDIKLVTEGIVSIYVAEMAPALSVLAETILGMDSGLNSVRDSARLVSDTIVATIGNAKDLLDVYVAMRDPLNPLKMAAAIDVGTADRMLEQVIEKRLKIDNEMSRRKLDRAEKETQEESDNFKDLIDGNAKAWDSFLDDREDRNKRVIKAIDQAEKELDRNRKEREKTRKELEKGPMSMDVGSAEAARFFASQANARLASQAMSDNGKPTEEQILDEAVKQSQLIEQQAATSAQLKTKLDELISATKENGFKRLR